MKQASQKAIKADLRRHQQDIEEDAHELARYADSMMNEIEDAQVERAQIIRGINPDTGRSYTSSEHKEAVDKLHLTPAEKEAYREVTYARQQEYAIGVDYGDYADVSFEDFAR